MSLRDITVNWLLRVIFLSALALLVGCATGQSKQARRVEKSGFLGDYSMLRPGGEGEALLSYENPEANWPAYNKIFLAPVAYYGGRDTYPKGYTRADLQELVNRFYYILYNDLAEDYQMVDEADPHTLRIPSGAHQCGGVLSDGGLLSRQWCRSLLIPLGIWGHLYRVRLF